MQRSRYTDAIEDDEDRRNVRRFLFLPQNRFAAPKEDDPAILVTTQYTSLDEITQFCQLQQRAFPVYLYNSLRDGTEWLNTKLIPFSRANQRFQPMLIIDTACNDAVRDYFRERSWSPCMCFSFRGMFYGFEKAPIDLPKLLQMNTGAMGDDYYN